MASPSWITTLSVGALIVLLPLLMVTIVVYLGMTLKLFGYLRQNQPGQYEKLGEPHLFLNNSPSLSRRAARFIADEDYSRIGDPALTAIGDRTRWFYGASKWLFVSSLIALFTFWFSL